MIPNRELHTIVKKTLRHGLLMLSLVVFCTPLSSFQKNTLPSYLPVKLTKNMSVAQIMERYQLNEYDCNEQHFLKINDLKTSSTLLKGKTYNLPVYVYSTDSIKAKYRLTFSNVGQGNGNYKQLSPALMEKYFNG